MRFINHIDELLHRSECIRTDGTPAISIRRLREYIRNSAVRIKESELRTYFKTHKTYSDEEIKNICDKLYRPTPADEQSNCFV